jgi:hypothetical protein
MTDDSFRSKFSASPTKTMQSSGYALDQHEIAALAEINLEDLAITVVRNRGPLTVCHGQAFTKDE